MKLNVRRSDKKVNCFDRVKLSFGTGKLPKKKPVVVWRSVGLRRSGQGLVGLSVRTVQTAMKTKKEWVQRSAIALCLCCPGRALGGALGALGAYISGEYEYA
jgi:hypothetical protein